MSEQTILRVFFIRYVPKAASTADVTMLDSGDEKDADGDILMRAVDWVSDSDPQAGEPFCSTFCDTDASNLVKIFDGLLTQL